MIRLPYPRALEFNCRLGEGGRHAGRSVGPKSAAVRRAGQAENRALPVGSESGILHRFLGINFYFRY